MTLFGHYDNHDDNDKNLIQNHCVVIIMGSILAFFLRKGIMLQQRILQS